MTKKEIAIEFLGLASRGKAQEAFKLNVDENFKHHNAYFKGDRNTLMNAMDENALKNPNKIFEILRILGDGDLVAVYSRAQLGKNEKELSIIHIFKFDKDKIIELWDFGQEVPTSIINENGMF